MDKRRQKILSVLILALSVAILFCFAGEKWRTGEPEEEKTETAGTVEEKTDLAKEAHAATESLIGVTLGEKYNYDEFESIGGGRYRPKELVL